MWIGCGREEDKRKYWRMFDVAPTTNEGVGCWLMLMWWRMICFAFAGTDGCCWRRAVWYHMMVSTLNGEWRSKLMTRGTPNAHHITRQQPTTVTSRQKFASKFLSPTHQQTHHQIEDHSLFGPHFLWPSFGPQIYYMIDFYNWDLFFVRFQLYRYWLNLTCNLRANFEIYL
jgi:hypothetical protein